MNTQKWIRITSCDNIPLREGRAVNVGGMEIAVFNLGDRFLAVDNRCPHNGGPLADGIVSGTTVVCPLHAWRVNLECGVVTKPADAGACQRTFPTRVEDGVVMVEVPLPDRPGQGTRGEEEAACQPPVAITASLTSIETSDRV